MTAATPPATVRADVSLARLTTVRTGGAADFFARAGSEAELLELLAWVRAALLPVSVVGSGSNLLIADEGVRGVVVKLDGALAEVVVGGGRSAADRVRRWCAVAGRGGARGA